MAQAQCPDAAGAAGVPVICAGIGESLVPEKCGGCGNNLVVSRASAGEGQRVERGVTEVPEKYHGLCLETGFGLTPSGLCCKSHL